MYKKLDNYYKEWFCIQIYECQLNSERTEEQTHIYTLIGIIYELADPFLKNDWLLWFMDEIVFQDNNNNNIMLVIIIYVYTNKGTIKAEKVVLRIGIYQQHLISD